MVLVFPERSWYNASPLEMKKNPTPEIQALIDKAKIPPGCNFQEAFQRLSCLSRMNDEDADYWAAVLAPEGAPDDLLKRIDES